MRPPRGLSDEERAAWKRLASTVRPLHSPRRGETERPTEAGEAPASSSFTPPPQSPRPPLRYAPAPRAPAPPKGEDRQTLDSTWDRSLARGKAQPDFTLDLHGLTLDAAHARLGSGLAQAKAMGARLVLVVTGKPRPVEAADRGERRGAIRAKILDWLAAGAHGADIAAIRNAHPRHGGEGALYIVLRRPR